MPDPFTTPQANGASTNPTLLSPSKFAPQRLHTAEDVLRACLPFVEGLLHNIRDGIPNMSGQQFLTEIHKALPPLEREKHHSFATLNSSVTHESERKRNLSNKSNNKLDNLRLLDKHRFIWTPLSWPSHAAALSIPATGHFVPKTCLHGNEISGYHPAYVVTKDARYAYVLFLGTNGGRPLNEMHPAAKQQYVELHDINSVVHGRAPSSSLRAVNYEVVPGTKMSLVISQVSLEAPMEGVDGWTHEDSLDLLWDLMDSGPNRRFYDAIMSEKQTLRQHTARVEDILECREAEKRRREAHRQQGCASGTESSNEGPDYFQGCDTARKLQKDTRPKTTGGDPSKPFLKSVASARELNQLADGSATIKQESVERSQRQKIPQFGTTGQHSPDHKARGAHERANAATFGKGTWPDAQSTVESSQSPSSVSESQQESSARDRMRARAGLDNNVNPRSDKGKVHGLDTRSRECQSRTGITTVANAFGKTNLGANGRATNNGSTTPQKRTRPGEDDIQAGQNDRKRQRR